MPKIVCYPRSGSHYLKQLLLQHTNTNLEKSHNPLEESDFIITIVRNPYDSIHSLIVMQDHYDEKYDIASSINAYIGFYKTVKPNFIIDYNSLIKNPIKVVKALTIALGLKYQDIDWELDLVDRPEELYIVTSTSSQKYKNVYIGKTEIADCIIPYKEMLDKKDI